MRQTRMRCALGHSSGEKGLPVMFRVWPKGKGGGVIALFPTTKGSTDNPYAVESYESASGHGPADLGIVQETRAATPEEFAPLKRELENAYNYQLRVVKRASRRMRGY